MLLRRGYVEEVLTLQKEEVVLRPGYVEEVLTLQKDELSLRLYVTLFSFFYFFFSFSFFPCQLTQEVRVVSGGKCEDYIRFLFFQLFGPVNHRQNWKGWERSGDLLDHQ